MLKLILFLNLFILFLSEKFTQCIGKVENGVSKQFKLPSSGIAKSVYIEISEFSGMTITANVTLVNGTFNGDKLLHWGTSDEEPVNYNHYTLHFNNTFVNEYHGNITEISEDEEEEVEEDKYETYTMTYEVGNKFNFKYMLFSIPDHKADYIILDFNSAGLTLTALICIPVACLVVLIVIIIFIVRCCLRRNSSGINPSTPNVLENQPLVLD